MELCLCCLVFAVIPIYIIVQLLRLLLADCDLTLQWATKFGKSPATLRGTVVWITGASSGIGEFLAYNLASAGCRLVLSARRESELERVKKRCLLSGPVKEEDILVLPLDLLKCDSHTEAADEVLKYFGQIDILVNNAGRSQRGVWEKISIEVDRDMMELNVIGTLSITKAVLPHMIENKRGHIVVISSVAGKLGIPNSCSYSGSKFALHGYFESLRIEAFQHNIKVTMICPGPVFSNVLTAAFTEKPGQAFGVAMNPNEKRMATDRCAYLTTVAMANSLDEVWISLQPVLLSFYVIQYFPTYGKILGCKLGMKAINKIREGQ
ncbi:dehydrogenase/reductase SDR family member 7-like [Gigantopelta aegis]|uniref:dehydrogenase/reductase SDR family member 7-like n=1 Tax=Gigantopelta aegis TaxID=1735272 RepID=UPI001B88AEDD|nr:dehydrogenase/reductase SDR family member 7-like [Gigantopelta aegis]